MTSVRELKEQIQKSGGKDTLARQKLFEKIQEENKKIDNKYKSRLNKFK